MLQRNERSFITGLNVHFDRYTHVQSKLGFYEHIWKDAATILPNSYGSTFWYGNREEADFACQQAGVLPRACLRLLLKSWQRFRMTNLSVFDPP